MFLKIHLYTDRADHVQTHRFLRVKEADPGEVATLSLAEPRAMPMLSFVPVRKKKKVNQSVREHVQ